MARKAAAHANLSRYHVTFAVNDIVIKYRGPRTPKLRHRWIGPFRVVAVERDGTYTLEATSESQQPRRNSSRHVVHVSYLRRYDSSRRTLLLLRDPDAVARAADAAPSEHPGALGVSSGTGDVSHIVNFTVLPSGEIRYRVRWEGYSEGDDTSEPYENVYDNEVFRAWIEDRLKTGADTAARGAAAAAPRQEQGRRRRRR